VFKVWTVVFALALFLWLSWSLPLELPFILGMPDNIADRGVWGDSFGALNTLFGAFGFGALLLTIILQQRAISQQKFEGHFFQLLELLRDTKKEIYFKYNDETVFGVEALKRIWSLLVPHLAEKSIGKNPSREEIANVYIDRCHKKYESSLGPYFRVLFNLIRLVDDEKYLSEYDKIRYANIIRSQLSSLEVDIIALNSLTADAKNLIDYVNRYRLIRYISRERVFIIVEPYYDKTVFKNRND